MSHGRVVVRRHGDASVLVGEDPGGVQLTKLGVQDGPSRRARLAARYGLDRHPVVRRPKVETHELALILCVIVPNAHGGYRVIEDDASTPLVLHHHGRHGEVRRARHLAADAQCSADHPGAIAEDRVANGQVLQHLQRLADPDLALYGQRVHEVDGAVDGELGLHRHVVLERRRALHREIAQELELGCGSQLDRAVVERVVHRQVLDRRLVRYQRRQRAADRQEVLLLLHVVALDGLEDGQRLADLHVVVDGQVAHQLRITTHGQRRGVHLPVHRQRARQIAVRPDGHRRGLRHVHAVRRVERGPRAHGEDGELGRARGLQVLQRRLRADRQRPHVRHREDVQVALELDVASDADVVVRVREPHVATADEFVVDVDRVLHVQQAGDAEHGRERAGERGLHHVQRVRQGEVVLHRRGDLPVDHAAHVVHDGEVFLREVRTVVVDQHGACHLRGCVKHRDLCGVFRGIVHVTEEGQHPPATGRVVLDGTGRVGRAGGHGTGRAGRGRQVHQVVGDRVNAVIRVLDETHRMRLVLEVDRVVHERGIVAGRHLREQQAVRELDEPTGFVVGRPVVRAQVRRDQSVPNDSVEVTEGRLRRHQHVLHRELVTDVHLALHRERRVEVDR